MKKILFLTLGILVIVAGCQKQTQSATEPSEPTEPVDSEKIADALLAGEYENVYRQTSDAFQNQVPLDDFKKLGEDFQADISTYTLDSSLPLDGQIRYTWTDQSKTKGLLAVVDEDETITGLRLLPLTQHPETDEAFTETTFKLPFDDELFVFWGGTNVLVNYHYELPVQRYALDFIGMNNGSSFEGDAEANESYHAFGKEILAPADGTVVTVVNDIEDNDPVGEMNAEQPLGNHVIIDHGQEEYSILAHLKQGSTMVEEGAEVIKGLPIGLLGNSGNSSEPHLHFQVSNSASFTDGESIRIRFEGDETYTQGDTVSNS